MSANRLHGVANKPFRRTTFEKLFPGRHARALYDEACEALSEKKIPKSHVRVIGYEVGSGIIVVKVEHKDHRSGCPIWEGRWPDGDVSPASPIAEIFGVPLLRDDLPRRLDESGESYTRRVYQALDAQDAGLSQPRQPTLTLVRN